MRDISGFFILVALILLALLGTWFGLKNYGLSQPVSNYQTPLVKSLIDQSDLSPISWSSDPMNKHLYIQTHYNGNQWVFTDKVSTSLHEYIEKLDFSQKKVLLFFEGKDAKALPEIRKIFQDKQRWQSTIFCSRFDGLLKDLRNLEPRWTFCSGEIYMTRLLAMTSLGLQSLLNITADVVVIHRTNINLSSKETEEIILEAERQNKMSLIGPFLSAEETRHWTRKKPNGWVVQPRDQKVQ